MFLKAQSDTICAIDTTIVSVRVINYTDNLLRYFYLDSNKKKLGKIPLEKINKIIYEHDVIEVFCDLISTKKFLGTKTSIDINFGNRDSLWVDPKIFTLIKSELKEYTSIIDALNYMGNEGWKTISSYSTSQNSYLIEHFILKKELKKELKKK